MTSPATLGKKSAQWPRFAVLSLALLFLITPFLGPFEIGTAASAKMSGLGFNGVAYRTTVPGEKVTFIQYDPEGLLDDYSYLASVPASVFYSDSSDMVVGHPVLFTQDSLGIAARDDPMLAQDARQGVDYLMEDINAVSVGGTDVIQTINIEDSKIDGLMGNSNGSKPKVLKINEDNPYDVAYDLAKTNWEYSDTAVVAIIKESYQFAEVSTQGEVTGTTPSDPVITGSFEGQKDPSPVDPNEHEFKVADNYKYIQAKMTWGQDWSPYKEQLQRGKDPDLQLYCGELGEVGASEEWNVLTGATEQLGSYVYYPGTWWFAVTYMPTEDLSGDLASEIADQTPPDFPKVGSTCKYTIDYSMYPGVDMVLPVETPYACRDATFELTWGDTGQTLGLIVCGPSGAEISTSLDPEAMTQVVNIPQLGEGQYKVAVVAMSADATATDFKVTYSWKQARPDSEADCIASATNGAVLASTFNAPLLYSKWGAVPEATFEALDLLGVETVYLVNLNDIGKPAVKNQLEDHRGLLQADINVKEVNDYYQMYSLIKKNTRNAKVNDTDLVFSCVEPHSYWGANTDAENPKGEEAGGHFFGPAALEAAMHGCPVFITESHPELSCAQAWHNEFWLRAYVGRLPPSVACMVLEGKEVYKVMGEMGYDPPGQESIITVADQFDIGTAWDRALVGPATPGRIQGTPVDCSVWVSRSIFYPDLIYANPAVDPALDPTGGKRITGSESTRVAGALRITQPVQEVQTTMPIMESWVSYQHRFNEVASEYWGCDYVSATGIVPYRTPSGNSIDPNGKWPDISTSELVPYYFDQCGYDQVFSTGPTPIYDNLDRGVILWFEVMHGGNSRGGCLGFWDETQTEPNPWRGYEENLYALQGATDNPDVVSMSKQIGLDILPTNPNPTGSALLERHDGVIIAISQQQQTSLVTGFDMNENLGNLHSVGFSAGSCLIASSYLHTAMVRHGSVFQVIDPWLTSWYATFAMECFVRGIALGSQTAGQLYEQGIKQVGIEYLSNGWWWDIFENLVFYGDPDIMIFSPNNAWAKPIHLPTGKSVDGHNIFGATNHPNEISSNMLLIFGIVLLVLGAVAAAVIIFLRRRRALAGS